MAGCYVQDSHLDKAYHVALTTDALFIAKVFLAVQEQSGTWIGLEMNKIEEILSVTHHHFSLI